MDPFSLHCANIGEIFTTLFAFSYWKENGKFSPASFIFVFRTIVVLTHFSQSRVQSFHGSLCGISPLQEGYSRIRPTRRFRGFYRSSM